MASYSPVVGHHIIVADKASAYNGREAIVFQIANEGRSFWCRIGNVEFLLPRANLRELKYDA
jgi:hypothetical protein